MIAPKTVTILGNFSGRNAGDNALLDNAMTDIQAAYPSVRFIVPTWNPGFIRSHFPGYPVEPVSLRPWRLTIKMLGIPTLKACLDGDIVLITDAILFDRKLWNPMHNYLLPISLFSNILRQRTIPIGMYNVSLGPITSRAGERLLRTLVRNSAFFTCRDQASVDLLKDLGVARNVFRTADSAVNTPPASAERVEEIFREHGIQGTRPLAAFNINAYFDRYYEGIYSAGGERIRKESFIRNMARTIDRFMEEHGVDIIIPVTQVMDIPVSRALREAISSRERVTVLDNRTLSHRDFVSVFQRVELVVGMRTHSLILATSIGTPAVGIVTYPKTQGYFDLIGQGNRAIRIDAPDFSKRLEGTIKEVWENRKEIRQTIDRTMASLKPTARFSAEVVRAVLERRTIPLVDSAVSGPQDQDPPGTL